MAQKNQGHDAPNFCNIIVSLYHIVACDLGYPCAKFRLPRPFGFRVRADVRDIRQTDGLTDGRTTDADDRLMPPPPLWGRGHNNYRGQHDYVAGGRHARQKCQFLTRSRRLQKAGTSWSSCVPNIPARLGALSNRHVSYSHISSKRYTASMSDTIYAALPAI